MYLPGGHTTELTQDGDATQTQAQALPLGQRLGPYRLVRYVGSGAMGLVYKAIDEDFKEPVAIKTLARMEPRRLFSLKHEFRALAGVRHPNLVRHDELAKEGDDWYFAMEYVDGEDIMQVLQRNPEWLSPVMGQLIGGLAHLHDSGVLHLDLKPSNILVTASRRVVILDFGLAQTWKLPLESRSTGSPGTPGFIAPERRRGKVPSPASDWFAVGVILFKTLVGRLPEGQERPSTCGAQISVAIDDLCYRLLADEPTQRPTAAELVEQFGVAKQQVSREAPLVGRADELAVLAKVFEQVTPGQPEVCWITGPGGIGKTRVVSQALVERAASSSDLMIYGRSYACESVPYGGVDAALDRLTQDLPAMVTDDPAIAAAVALFPVLKTRITVTEALQFNDRARAFAGVRTLLAKAAGGRQLILFLDDIDRAGDDTAALLLDLLLPRDDELKLVIVATVRCDHGRHPWLERIHERATTRGQSLVATDLSLGPLDSAACEALVRSVSDDPAFDYSEIAADAGGSPLVAELLARHGGTRSTGISELVDDRLTGLGTEARRVLAMVSLVGQPIALRTLLRATGGSAIRQTLGELLGRTLVRVSGPRSTGLVEAYHDQIGEGVRRLLPPTDRREWHRALATAYEREDDPPPEILMQQWLGAEERGHARRYAAVAIERAEQALAYQRAADLLGEVASWTSEPLPRAELYERQGAALTRAGRNTDAALAYGKAANHPALTGRAEIAVARALLAAGHVDRGLDGLRPLLAREQLVVPRSSVAAGSALLWEYLRLRARGQALPSVPDTRLQRRFDLCWSVGMGLVQVRPVEGMLFLLRGLRAALDSGDSIRAGRGLAAYGSFHRMLGAEGISQRSLAQAREIADAHDDATLAGFVDIAHASDALLTGTWTKVVEHARAGVDTLRDAGIGMTWERVVGGCFELVALEQLGRLPEVETRASENLRAAEACGDLYARIVFSQFFAQASLARGDLDKAAYFAGNGLSEWTSRQYTVQSFYELRVLARCDLYRAEPLVARDRVLRAWPDIKRAGLLRTPISRIDAYLLLARCALACGDSRMAQRAAKKLAPGLRRDAGLHRAWILQSCGARGARHNLQACQQGFRRLDMLLYADAIGYRLAKTQAEREVFEDRLLARGIRQPEQWMRSFLPTSHM